MASLTIEEINKKYEIDLTQKEIEDCDLDLEENEEVDLSEWIRELEKGITMKAIMSIVVLLILSSGAWAQQYQSPPIIIVATYHDQYGNVMWTATTTYSFPAPTPAVSWPARQSYPVETYWSAPTYSYSQPMYAQVRAPVMPAVRSAASRAVGC